MVTSEVQICNSALIKLGAERIVSLDDANNRARLLKEQYPKIRDKELRGHPWKFAIKRSVLAVITPKPSGFDEWAYVYQLPADNLRIIEPVNYSDYDQWNTESGLYFLSNISTTTVRHIFRQSDVTKFDDSFVEVLACAIAADLAYAFTQSSNAVTNAQKAYDAQLMVARSFNAQQGSSPRVHSEDFFDSHRY